MKERKWTPCFNEKAILSLSQSTRILSFSLLNIFTLSASRLFLSTESVTQSTHICNIKRKIGIEKSRSTCIHIRFSITKVKFTTAIHEMDPEVLPKEAR